MKASLHPQLVGNAGLFYCCYRLSLIGWNVMPTARNAKGVDLVAYNADASRVLTIQVKSLSKQVAVPVGVSVENLMGDYWVIVTGIGKEPHAFIMLPEEVRSLAQRSGKDARASYWLEPQSYEQREFQEAWLRIGYGGVEG